MSLPKATDLFAAEVQYWRLEPEHWRAVLERALEAGLPGVSSYVPWEVHEIEKGRFDFDGSTDPRKNLVRYLDLVKELGLKLAYRPGPFVCNEMDWGGLPRRIVTRDVDMMVLQAEGVPAPGYRIATDEGYQPSYLHPAYLDEVREWFGAADGVVREYTAARGGPINTCNLDNELSYAARDSMFGADYNELIVGEGGLYHRWLEGKYGGPEGVPYARRYDSIEEVEPPRELADDVEKNLTWYFDWIEFKECLLAEYLRTLREMHEEFGLEGVQFYTNLNPHRPEGVPTNLRRYADAVGGLVGYDFYRSPWLKYSGYSSMARVLKVMGATLPVVWSAEFMSGTWRTDMTGGRVPRSHMEFMALGALAGGCKATSWFMFHDRDMWGDAPVSEMGHRREGLDAVKAVMDAVRAIPEWNDLRPVTDLAVAYYRPYMWHCHLGDPNPCDEGVLHVGEPVLWGQKAGESVAEYEGLFRVIQQAGYTAGCVDLTDAPERLEGRKLVWLAAEPFCEPAASGLLADYVRSGGTLVVNLAWPRFDLRGQALDFLGLGGPPSGGEKRGEFYSVTLGEGKVLWLPRSIAAGEPGEEDPAAVAEIKSFLADLIGAPAVDVTTPVVRWKTWKEGGGTGPREEPRNLVDAVLHEGAGGRILFLVNLHERAVRATVSFREQAVERLDEVRGEVGGAGVSFEVEGGRATVDIDRKTVRVFRVVT